MLLLKTLRQVLALALATACLSAIAAPNDIKPLPTTTGDRQIFPLGMMDGFPVYATSIQRNFNYQPGAICFSEAVFVKADPNALNRTTIKPILIKAVQKLYHDICNKAMKPDWRDFLKGYLLDEVNFKLLLEDKTYDEYRTYHVIHIPLPPEKLIAQDQENQRYWASMMPTLKANEARLKDLFATHHIAAWVSLSDYAENPFTYGKQTILTVARLKRALSADVVEAIEPTRNNNYYTPPVVLANTQAGTWAASVSKLLVIRPTGRYKNEENNPASAEVILAMDCKEKRCEDLLNIPDTSPKEDKPPVRVLGTGERL
jgi:hypothetical protein